MKLLIIDDDPVSQMTLVHKALYSHPEASVDPASSFGEALSKLKTKKYDLIICSYWLDDGKNALDVQKHVHPRTPFIVMTSRGSDALSDDNYKVIQKGDWDGLLTHIQEVTPPAKAGPPPSSHLKISRGPDGGLTVEEPKSKWVKWLSTIATAAVPTILTAAGFIYAKGESDATLTNTLLKLKEQITALERVDSTVLAEISQNHKEVVYLPTEIKALKEGISEWKIEINRRFERLEHLTDRRPK